MFLFFIDFDLCLKWKFELRLLWIFVMFEFIVFWEYFECKDFLFCVLLVFFLFDFVKWIFFEKELFFMIFDLIIVLFFSWNEMFFFILLGDFEVKNSLVFFDFGFLCFEVYVLDELFFDDVDLIWVLELGLEFELFKVWICRFWIVVYKFVMEYFFDNLKYFFKILYCMYCVLNFGMGLWFRLLLELILFFLNLI